MSAFCVRRVYVGVIMYMVGWVIFFFWGAVMQIERNYYKSVIIKHSINYSNGNYTKSKACVSSTVSIDCLWIMWVKMSS